MYNLVKNILDFLGNIFQVLEYLPIEVTTIAAMAFIFWSHKTKSHRLSDLQAWVYISAYASSWSFIVINIIFLVIKIINPESDLTMIQYNLGVIITIIPIANRVALVTTLFFFTTIGITISSE